MSRNRKGFTLIELLIVVVIIGILAAIAIPKFANTKDKAYVAAMKSDLRNMATYEEQYAAARGIARRISPRSETSSPLSSFRASSSSGAGGVNPGGGVNGVAVGDRLSFRLSCDRNWFCSVRLYGSIVTCDRSNSVQTPRCKSPSIDASEYASFLLDARASFSSSRLSLWSFSNPVTTRACALAIRVIIPPASILRAMAG